MTKDRQIRLIDPPLWGELRRAAAGELRWPLVLLGPPGVGKTCAALCLLDLVGGFYFSAGDLAAEVIQAQQGRLLTVNGRETVWPERVWRELGKSALVVLDDINGASRVSNHHCDCVRNVLKVREGKPLVCASNLDLERIEALYDKPVASRLAGGFVLAVEGEDRRLQRD